MFFESSWLPLFIFCARIVDVSLGTIRIICVVRGFRTTAVIMAFLEVAIWVYAVAGVFSHLDQIINVLAYAAGFATGNAVGMWIEQKLALGDEVSLASFIDQFRNLEHCTVDRRPRKPCAPLHWHLPFRG